MSERIVQEEFEIVNNFENDFQIVNEFENDDEEGLHTDSEGKQVKEQSEIIVTFDGAMEKKRLEQFLRTYNYIYRTEL